MIAFEGRKAIGYAKSTTGIQANECDYKYGNELCCESPLQHIQKMPKNHSYNIRNPSDLK